MEFIFFNFHVQICVDRLSIYVLNMDLPCICNGSVIYQSNGVTFDIRRLWPPVDEEMVDLMLSCWLEGNEPQICGGWSNGFIIQGVDLVRVPPLFARALSLRSE